MVLVGVAAGDTGADAKALAIRESGTSINGGYA